MKPSSIKFQGTSSSEAVVLGLSGLSYFVFLVRDWSLTSENFVLAGWASRRHASSYANGRVREIVLLVWRTYLVQLRTPELFAVRLTLVSSTGLRDASIDCSVSLSCSASTFRAILEVSSQILWNDTQVFASLKGQHRIWVVWNSTASYPRAQTTWPFMATSASCACCRRSPNYCPVLVLFQTPSSQP